MALISIDKAAAQIGVPAQTLELWAKEGLLPIHQSSNQTKLQATARMERLVEEGELKQLAETLGWLHLSSEHWDGEEE